MDRREFTKIIGILATGCSWGKLNLLAAKHGPEISITIDDFNWDQNLRLNPDQRNLALLEALRAHGNLKAALFVKGKNVELEKGKALLAAWDRAGHIIGNHSYSHQEYHSKKVDTASFTSDILKCEELIKNFPRFQKIFRFPYLKEGDTTEKRDAVRAFLKQHGYRNGHVTIDASDWAVENRLSARLAKEPSADVKPYRDFYLEHMWERAAYYDDLSRKVLGRSVKHTVLIHYNLLNALFLSDLLDMFKSKGWKLIDAATAFKDPVFTSSPNIVPAGESLLWALAKETGKFDAILRYPGEDSEYEKDKMDARGL